MPLFPILSRWKTEKFSTKKKFQKRLIIVLLKSVPAYWSQWHSNTIFTTTFLASVPSNTFSIRKTNKRVWWYICQCGRTKRSRLCYNSPGLFRVVPFFTNDDLIECFRFTNNERRDRFYYKVGWIVITMCSSFDVLQIRASVNKWYFKSARC